MADLPALLEYRKEKRKFSLFPAAAIILRVVFPPQPLTYFAACHFCFAGEFTFCFAFLYQVLILLLLQEENRGLRLKEELVVAAPRLQPSAIADQPDEEKLRLVSKLDGIVCSSEIVVI